MIMHTPLSHVVSGQWSHNLVPINLMAADQPLTNWHISRQLQLFFWISLSCIYIYTVWYNIQCDIELYCTIYIQYTVYIQKLQNWTFIFHHIPNLIFFCPKYSCGSGTFGARMDRDVLLASNLDLLVSGDDQGDHTHGLRGKKEKQHGLTYVYPLVI